MKGSIILHKTLGINPRLTVCPRCGGEVNEIALLGNQNTLYQYLRSGCQLHMRYHLGHRCPSCRGYSERVRELDAHEKVLASDICDKCKKELQEHKAIVEEGGVYWKCSNCHSEGVIKGNSELARAVREHSGIKAPDPVGIEFTEKECPVCSKKVDTDGTANV